MKYIIIAAVIGAVAYNALGFFIDMSFVTDALPALPSVPTWLSDIIG